MKTNIIVGILAVIVIAQGVVLFRMNQTISELTARVPQPEDASQEPADGEKPSSVEINTVTQRIAELEESVRQVESQANAVELTLDEVRGLAQTASESVARITSDGGVLVPSGDGSSDLEAMIDRKVAEKVAEKDDSPINRKPSVNELKAKLDLTAYQSDELTKTLNAAKDRMFDLLSTPRPDGTSVADDILKAFTDPDGEAAENPQVFLKFLSEKIPGAEDTYLKRIIQMQGEVYTELEMVLNQDQIRELRQADVEIFEVKTGYDPFAEYLAK